MTEREYLERRARLFIALPGRLQERYHTDTIVNHAIDTGVRRSWSPTHTLEQIAIELADALDLAREAYDKHMRACPPVLVLDA